MMPLSMAKEGRLARIVRIIGGRGFVSRLMNMGINEGEIIKVLNNTRGPVLISVGNSRIALGGGASFRIFVEYVKEG
ncbi:MAG TPA: ferrous iron transport protein A [Candidatus Omnitrophica bacterium]|nr:ferrous iron transport protein A [Candidatus Omnitrophota bacterium]